MKFSKTLFSVLLCATFLVLTGIGVYCGGQQPQTEGVLAVAKPFFDVGKQPDITMLINNSPWFPGFEKLVELYEKQTGNVVKLDVTPYAGMLEKTRNALHSKESPYDIVNMDTQNTVEMYSGGLLTPIHEIDPNFELDPAVIGYDECHYWNPTKQWRTKNGGKLMGLPTNGNYQLYYYRADLYQEAGLAPPETWDDAIVAAEKMHDPPNLYGYVVRGARGNQIRFGWMPFMLGHNAGFVRDPANGDFTVTINSPEAKQALDLYIELAERFGPPNSGAIAQSELLQLMTTGKALQLICVTAAWPHMDNPDTSLVVGKVGVTVNPKPTEGEHASAIGNWIAGIPHNVSDEQKKGALAFMKWFLTYDAQYKYGEFGSVPVREDIFETDLAQKEEFRWMKAYKRTIPYAHQVLGYTEGPQLVEISGLRLNQALIGELSSAEALNLMAEEMHQVFLDSGRETGMLPKLPD